MYLMQWQHLTESEKRQIIRDAVKRDLDHYHTDFGGYTEREGFVALLDAFVTIAGDYLRTHSHFGGKAIWEILRYHSFATDGDTTFKLNNNFTSSVTRLTQKLFPEELADFFEARPGRVA